MRFCATFLLLTTLSLAGFAQWKVVPVPKIYPQKKLQATVVKKAIKNAGNVGGRLMDTVLHRTPLQLPFWDDFSSSNVNYTPDTTRWVESVSVSWNYGIGINPPSLGVVSFNGLDSVGEPYNVTNSLAKGFGDRLVSWPIDLSNIPPAEQDSLYLSFFYEYKGNGEEPDAGDYLLVEFKTDTGNWEQIAQIDKNLADSLNYDSLFIPVIYKISGPRFLHDQFQFRVRSFGRISGPWDNWNVDYFYLNTHRFATDISFPDRTIVTPVSSLFGDYWSIPAKHFHHPADTALIVHPTSVVNVLRLDDSQAITYSMFYNISEWKNGSLSGTNSVAFPAEYPIPGPDGDIFVHPNEFKVAHIKTIPSYTDFTTDSDSILVNGTFLIHSGDNRTDQPDDYRPKYVPIDFRVNDTVRFTQTLASYYAYDDGSAEFAAGLNQPGTEMAYRFDMKNDTVDNLIGVDLYFPDVGDQSNQTIILTVRTDTTTQGSVYSETLIIQRSAFDRFIHHKFDRNIHVSGHFYIGWVQTGSVLVAVGLDTSHDTADKIYYNLGGLWQTHPNLEGSLMIRPRLGGKVITGLEENEIMVDVYPNPGNGSFYLSRDVDAYEVMDFTGRRINTTKEGAGSQVKINLENPVSGIYLLKVRVDGRTTTRRVIVR